MSRKPKLALIIFVACLMAALGAMTSTRAVADQVDPEQQVAPQHEVDEKAGQDLWTPSFMSVYLWKNGDWGANNCIGIFPADVDISLSKKPSKIRWLILKKTGSNPAVFDFDRTGEFYWSVDPKTAGDDMVPPLAKKIKKGKNAFKSDKPKKTGDWDYKITLKEEENTDCEAQNAKCCVLDPRVKVRG
jgi:hypothetical protein